MDTPELYKINIGTLSSLYSLNTRINEVKKFDLDDRETAKRIVFDLSDLEPKEISLSAITSFLSYSYYLSKKIGRAIPVTLRWNPYVIKFLHSIDFFDEARRNNILYWDERMIGGFSLDKFNPNSKIISFTDKIPRFDYNDKSSLSIVKSKIGEDISETVRSKISRLFVDSDYYRIPDLKVIKLLTTICTELVVNSIVHGKSIAFLGVQRSRSRISVVVTDSGIGFLESIKLSNPNITKKIKSNIEALTSACFLKSYPIGLTDAIDSVIKNSGWVIMSSIDCEICWKQYNWSIADKNSFIKNEELNLDKIFPLNLSRFVYGADLEKGYYRLYDYSFPGSRIAFEIPL